MKPATVHMFCLPHSGASAMVYSRWRRQLPAWLEARPLELPGRGRRFGEPLLTDLQALVRQLVMDIRDELHQPYAIFGHSLGALLGFELTHALVERGLPEPLALFCSASAGPMVRDTREYAVAKTDTQLLQRLRELGGTSEQALASPELMAMMLPVLRADFLLAGGYRYTPRRPLGVPLHVLGGRQDTVDVEHLANWQEETTGSFSLDLFEGGHFFIQDKEPEVLRCVCDHLHKHLAGISQVEVR